MMFLAALFPNPSIAWDPAEINFSPELVPSAYLKGCCPLPSAQGQTSLDGLIVPATPSCPREITLLPLTNPVPCPSLLPLTLFNKTPTCFMFEQAWIEIIQAGIIPQKES